MFRRDRRSSKRQQRKGSASRETKARWHGLHFQSSICLCNERSMWTCHCVESISAWQVSKLLIAFNIISCSSNDMGYQRHNVANKHVRHCHDMTSLRPTVRLYQWVFLLGNAQLVGHGFLFGHWHGMYSENDVSAWCWERQQMPYKLRLLSIFSKWAASAKISPPCTSCFRC